MKKSLRTLVNGMKSSQILSAPLNRLFKKKYIFIFSHMRSRSSVLSHILGSNPRICGYSELHILYKDNESLIKMQKQLTEELNCSPFSTYQFDKILHNFEFSDEVYEMTQPKIIFLLREPESTIKSIINMGYITGVDWYSNPEEAVDYYCSRLEGLEELSTRIRGNYYFIESDDLINDTDKILSGLTSWLELRKPLCRKYSIFKNTGKPKYGDPSDKIKSGVLERTEGYPDIHIPPEVLRIGEAAYLKCKRTLLESKSP